jgi:hypothetical protein
MHIEGFSRISLTIQLLSSHAIVDFINLIKYFDSDFTGIVLCEVFGILLFFRDRVKTKLNLF